MSRHEVRYDRQYQRAANRLAVLRTEKKSRQQGTRQTTEDKGLV